MFLPKLHQLPILRFLYVLILRRHVSDVFLCHVMPRSSSRFFYYSVLNLFFMSLLRSIINPFTAGPVKALHFAILV